MNPWPPPVLWTKFFEAVLLPPSGLIVLALMGLILLRTRLRRWGVGLAVLSLAGLLALATPIVEFWLLGTLDRYPPLATDPAQLPAAECIVVLGGGVRFGAREYGGDTVSAAALERLRYGAWLHRRTKRPILVTGTGGHLMAEALRESFGVPVRWVERESRTTHENAVFTARILSREGISRVYLVTHFWHLPRARTAFHRAGLQPVPAPLGFAGRDSDERGVLTLIPRTDTLWGSRRALHEWAARLWYRLRYGHPLSDPA